MTKAIAALVASVVLVVALAGTAMAQESEVLTDFWDGGVYTQAIGNRVDGQTGCRFIVAVDAASVGAVVEAEVDGSPVSAVVQPHYFPARTVHHGRATFVVEVGQSLVTTNTSPAVGASC